ncbi:hypothetical protein PIB30_107189, partial [Stylosanthes scabra]|nr:hypothetical protein [Stylosanthes scabra]
MDPEIVSRLQSFNARRKLRAAAITSVWSTTMFLRTKKLKSLIGSYDLTEDEIENLRIHFKKMDWPSETSEGVPRGWGEALDMVFMNQCRRVASLVAEGGAAMQGCDTSLMQCLHLPPQHWVYAVPIKVAA